MRNARRISIIGAGLVAAGLVVSAAAWACSPTGSLTGGNGVEFAQGAAGSQVTVTGKGFNGSEPVLIHWNTVPNKIAEVKGPSFSVAVTIPADAREGVYYLQATQGDEQAPAPMAFEVTQAAPAPPQAEQSVGAGVTSGRVSGAPTATAGGTSPVAPSLAPTGPGSVVTSGPSALPASANPPALVSGPGVAVFGGSVAPALDEAARARANRAATGDLWSGFRSGTRPSLGTGSADNPGSPGVPNLAIGVGLMSAGLVALAGGFGVAEVRRRRAPAGASTL
jgi:hypothetical protein